jgi:SET domain-containing protein
MTLSQPLLARRPAASHGYGIFTDEPLKTGDYVLTMSGKILPASQVGDEVRAMQIGPETYLVEDIAPGHDGSEPQYLDNYLNHSCEPNVGFIRGTLELYALRDIATGEELLWDYSSSMNAPGWSLPCFCNSRQCRGRIESFCDLSPEAKQRLLPIALSYLRP